MTRTRVIHFRPDLSSPNTSGTALCGTVGVWHNWTPFLTSVTCKKCRATIFPPPTTPARAMEESAVICESVALRYPEDVWPDGDTSGAGARHAATLCAHEIREYARIVLAP